jgi:hypothetical protein
MMMSCKLVWMDEFHVSHIFMILPLQLGAMYCLLQLEFYATCSLQLGTIASHMW